MVPLHALIEEDGFAKVLAKEGAIRQTDRKTPEKDILFLFVIGKLRWKTTAKQIYPVTEKSKYHKTRNHPNN